MSRIFKVIKALSETELKTDWPAIYIKEKIMPMLDSQTKRFLNLASLIVNLYPIISKLKTFTMLSEREREEWLKELKPESFAQNALDILKFIISAVYYVNPKHAIKIGYKREPLIKPKQPPITPSITSKIKPRKEYDVIVIGSGAGGAVTAWSLSRKGLKVAIFEAGPEPIPEELFNDHPVHRALKYYWNHGLTFTWGTPIISLPFGRVLGGTTTVNSGTMFRIPDNILSLWYKETGVKLDSVRLDLAYKIVEEKLNVLPVPDFLLGGNAVVMRIGAEALGLNHGPVMRPLGDCCGMGECAFGCPYNGKLDMRLTFLKEAHHNGAEIFSNTKVDKIIIKSEEAKGVLVNMNGFRREVMARVIVVSAGAINTPRLLMISGIKNKNLGKHLHIHPAAGVMAIMEHPINGWKGTMQSYYVDDLLKEHHTLLLATFPPPGIGYSAGGMPLSQLNKYPYLASIGVQTSDDNEGEVLKKQIIGIAKYNLTESDLEKLKRGIKLAAEILLAAGARKVFLPIRKFMTSSNIKDALNLGPKAYKLSAYHPMSTARMGSDKEIGVVDASGRVYDISNLYIADASILPASTYVNPQLTINAISLIIAEKILKEL